MWIRFADINTPEIETEEGKEWQIREAVIKDNLVRRQLSDYQKVRAGLELEPIEKIKAENRQIELAGTRPSKETDLMENFPQGEEEFKIKEKKGTTRDIIAKAVGLGSGKQYEKAKKVYKEAPESIKKKCKKVSQ